MPRWRPSSWSASSASRSAATRRAASLDAFGVGGSGDTGASLSSQYDDQIESANEQLAKDPKDTAALLKLSKYEFYKAKEGITQDETTGQLSVSEDAHTELGNAADAWEKYLKVNKGQPSATIATQMVQAYYYLGDAQGAADAQRIVAEDQPNSGGWDDLAYYLYLAGDISGGDQAADRAVAETPKAQRSQLEQDLEQIRTEAVKAEEAAGEGAKERAIDHHSRRKPAPEPVRRRRRRALGPPPPRRYHPDRRAVSSTGRAGDS